MNTPDSIDSKAASGMRWATALSAAVVFVFYWFTCFRTFTWWDSSEYSVAAMTLGIPHPPGSLLTVLAGWTAVRLPLGMDKFFALNLLAALMAAITVYLVGRAAWGLFARGAGNDGRGTGGAIRIPGLGISLAALFFGLSATMWHYAIRFTPYMTTALMTALILLAILAWHRRSDGPRAHLWLALVMLLFGLDFSIHRTNLLMLPGFLIWIAIVKPKTFASIRSWVFGIAGLAGGLAIQLLLIPIAAGKPFINFNDPSSLSRFWDYITLKQYGGGWLINMFPRKGPFLASQVADYIRVFADNFIVGEWPILRYLPLVIGAAGLISLFRRNWRIGIGLTLLFLFSSLGAVVYFNLPENFFRSIDRHYMPSFVIFGVLIALGSAALLQNVYGIKGKYRLAALSLAAALLILMPVQAALRNYGRVDGSRSYFAYDTAKNFLANLPRNAVLFTQADIDTYTLWCLQVGEKFRTDVTVCNLSLMNTPWFIEQVIERDDDFPARLNKDEIRSLSIMPWHDSTVAMSAEVDVVDFEFPPGEDRPDTVRLVLRPTLDNQYVYVHDQMILKTITANDWRRPICFSALLPESTIGWLMPNLRFEGLWWRLVPVRSEAWERSLLRANLLEKYSYRGFADPAIPKEDPTRWIGWNLCSGFFRLAGMEYSDGDTAACKATMERLKMLVAPESLSPPPNLQAALENVCQ